MKNPPVCDYEGSDYQHRFWDESDRAYEDAAEELAIRKLLPDKGKHLLELGAGAGRNTKRYQGFQRVTLLDYSTTQLAQAIERLGTEGYRFVAADMYRLPFGPNSFDGATMIRALHHLIYPQKALNETARVLTGAAVYVQEFANKRNLKAIIRYALGKQKWNPFSPEPVEFAELNFDFHPRHLREMLTIADFDIEKMISVSYLRAGFFKRLLPHKAMVGMENVLQRLASWTAYSPSIFLRTKKCGEQTALDESGNFQCPACGHYPIPDTPPRLVCEECSKTYTYKNGIYDFRVLDEDTGKE